MNAQDRNVARQFHERRYVDFRVHHEPASQVAAEIRFILRLFMEHPSTLFGDTRCAQLARMLAYLCVYYDTRELDGRFFLGEITDETFARAAA